MGSDSNVTSGIPPINEMVNLLVSVAPTDLTRLRNELPEIRALLEPGVVLGESDATIIPLAKVAQAVLAKVATSADNIAGSIANRLRNAARVRLTAQVAAALGSSSVIGFVFAKQFGASLFSGFIALVGSLASIVVDYLNRPVAGNVSPLDYYATLRQMHFEAEQIGTELTIRLRSKNPDEARLTELVRQANELARRINAELAKSV